MTDILLTPPAVNITLWAGNQSSVEFRWPTGALDGRTFRARVVRSDADLAPAADVVDDSITVTFSAAQSAALKTGGVGRFELIETTGVENVVIGGSVRATSTPSTTSTSIVTVLAEQATVEVTVLPVNLQELGSASAADLVAETTRAAAAESALGAAVTAEATTRATADTALAASITAEATTRASADAAKAAAGDAASAGSAATDALLKSWVSGESYELTSITRDGNNVVTSGTVKWPDGSAGTFTTTTKNTSPPAVNAYTISHSLSGKTVTQSLMTRNTAGAVTVKPALTVA